MKKMTIIKLISEMGITKYRLAKLSGVPHATLSDLCGGKTRIEKCSAETIYKIAKALGVPIELLLEDAMQEKEQRKKLEQAYEHGLPGYLQHNLDAFKQGLAEKSSLMDCYWGELYGSINAAEITDGIITPEHAEYLRQKYLWRWKGRYRK